MSIFDDYKNRVNGNIKGSILTNTKKIYSTNFSHSPSYFEVAINSSSILTGVQIVDDSDVRDQKRVTSIDFQLSNGDIIRWQGYNWINILTDNMSDIYCRGTLKKCVGELKWLNDEGVIRQSYFSFHNDPSTNFGIDYGRIMNTGNERRSLVIPVDIATLEISKGVRFIFDSRAWIVTAIDTISVNGLVLLTVEEDEINPSTDNIELGIADYVGKVANWSLSINGGDNISIQAGKTLQLTSKVKNNGVEVTGKTITYTSSNPSIATVNANGLLTTIANGSVVVTAYLADYPSVVDTQSVTIQFATTNNYSVRVIETPSVTVGVNKTFTVQVLTNGVLDNSKFVNWTLLADDKLNTTALAQLVSSSTTQCTLKGVSDGYVQLKVTIIGITPAQWVRVQIKGLF